MRLILFIAIFGLTLNGLARGSMISNDLGVPNSLATSLGIGTTAPAAALDVALKGTAASAIIVPRDTTGNRPTAPVNGMLRYNNTLNFLEAFANGGWAAVATGSGASQWITSGANIYYSAGNVAIGTMTPATALDVNGGIRAGSSASVTACAAGTEGTQRYNYSTHYMEFCNGSSWMQLPAQVPGSVASVTASGPPASANIYTYASVTANFTPGYGAIANTYDRNWPSNGTNGNRTAACAEIPSGTTYITFDLGATKSLGHVYFSSENSLGIGLTFSTDNVNYTSGLTVQSSGNDVQYGTVALSPTVTARYMRLTQASFVDPDYNTLCEIAVGP